MNELLRQLEDAISNIDYPGSDSTYWTSRAIELARQLASETSDVEGATNGLES